MSAVIEDAAGEPVVLPSHEDPFVAGVSTSIGGPVGRRARVREQRWLWTPIRVLLAFAIVTSTLGWAQKATCRTHAWSHEYQYTRMCYSDVFALYYAEKLVDGKHPYVDQPVEYPVVIGGIMETSRAVASTVDKPDRPAFYYDVTALLMTIAFLVVVVTTARLAGRRRVWDAAMVALAPAVVLHLMTNWDMAAVAVTGLAMLAWAKRRPALAGVLFGVGIATKLYPVLLLAPLFLLCLRAGRMKAWFTTFGLAVVSTLAVYLPYYVTSPAFADVNGTQTKVAASAWQVWSSGGGLGSALQALTPHQGVGLNGTLRFISLNRLRPADWDTIWYAVQTWVHHPLDRYIGPGQAPSLLNQAQAASFLVAFSLITALTLLAHRRPRFGQLAFLTVAAFLLTSKVFSPQYTLWLLPLYVLARPRWRSFLLWQATEAVLLLTRFMFFINNDTHRTGIEVGWFITAVIVRDLALVYLCVRIVWDVLHPADDVVRQAGLDDPAGGVLDGAPDLRARGDRLPVPA